MRTSSRNGLRASSLSEGLRPSDSPTRALAGPQGAPLRSRGSLADARSPIAIITIDVVHISSSPFAVVAAEGHLIDSQLLTAIFDTVINRGGAFEVQQFDIGRTNDEFSKLTMKVTAPDAASLSALVEALLPLGCHVAAEHDALVRGVDRDGCAPDDFHSTTNQRTQVRIGGRWIPVDRQRMDAAIVVDGDRAACRKLRDLRR